MNENETLLNINNINYTVKNVFADNEAETFIEKMKRLIVSEKIITAKEKNNKSHI